MTDEREEGKQAPEAEREGVRPVTPQGPEPSGPARTGRVRGQHSPGRGESKDRGVAERGETK